jgi:hypothetical protein
VLRTDRQVETAEGQKLAETWNCAFTEASARANENVARIFELMVGEVEKCPFVAPSSLPLTATAAMSPEEKKESGGKCYVS